MKYETLSYPLHHESPVHKGLLTPSIQPNSQINKWKLYNSYLIHVENHSGTHVDAPGHFLRNGRRIGDYHPEELIFTRPLILDCHKGDNELLTREDLEGVRLDGLDCLFFRTGFGKYRSDDVERYLTQNPGLSPELVSWIHDEYPGLRCLGTDTISISSYQNQVLGIEAHKNAFKKGRGDPLLLVEDLNLGVLEDVDQVREIMVIPWQILEVDSAPCTVLARLK
jgi:arylformamidase